MGAYFVRSLLYPLQDLRHFLCSAVTTFPTTHASRTWLCETRRWWPCSWRRRPSTNLQLGTHTCLSKLSKIPIRSASICTFLHITSSPTKSALSKVLLFGKQIKSVELPALPPSKVDPAFVLPWSKGKVRSFLVMPHFSTNYISSLYKYLE